MKVFTDQRCALHVVPFGFPECPARLDEILRGLRAAGHEIVDQGPHAGRDEAIESVHGADYPARFRRSVERGEGLFGSPDTPVGPGTWDAAVGAVDATLNALDWVASDVGRRAFAAIRPPGHHAERELAMGFCYFNNVAVAVERARRAHRMRRIAIFDLDVHHGNGTAHIFEDDPDVLYASTHQFPFYPGSGAADEVGVGAGRRATVNVPLPVGTGDDGYGRALDDVILPALEAHAPDLLLLSVGFDAWQGDRLGGMRVTADGFETWGRRLGTLADRVCEGRALAVLEGGYDLGALPELAIRFLKGLCDGDGVWTVD